jgi:UDP-N-acetylmuramate: L-alanyl-gamma-D-glutamyl-meso-diaminopimelate ligase
VVVGNAVSRTNPEVAAMLERGLASSPCQGDPAPVPRRQTLANIVAGTHGKTTSTAMLASVPRGGRDPSLMLGGESLDFGGNPTRPGETS